MDINLRFKSKGKAIEVGKGKSFRLLTIEGIEATENELFITSNIFADGSKDDNKKIKAKPIIIEAEYTRQDKSEERRRLVSFFNIHNDGKLIIQINNIEKAIDYQVEEFKAPLKNTNNPAVIVECGFISNEEECKNLLDSQYQKQMAYSITAGFLSYYNTD